MERTLKFSTDDCALIRDALRDYQVRLDSAQGGPEMQAARERAATLHQKFDQASLVGIEELPGWQPGEVTIDTEV